jgi:hypothetical protein
VARYAERRPTVDQWSPATETFTYAGTTGGAVASITLGQESLKVAAAALQATSSAVLDSKAGGVVTDGRGNAFGRRYGTATELLRKCNS